MALTAHTQSQPKNLPVVVSSVALTAHTQLNPLPVVVPSVALAAQPRTTSTCASPAVSEWAPQTQQQPWNWPQSQSGYWGWQSQWPSYQQPQGHGSYPWQYGTQPPAYRPYGGPPPPPSEATVVRPQSGAFKPYGGPPPPSSAAATIVRPPAVPVVTTTAGVRTLDARTAPPGGSAPGSEKQRDPPVRTQASRGPDLQTPRDLPVIAQPSRDPPAQARADGVRHDNGRPDVAQTGRTQGYDRDAVQRAANACTPVSQRQTCQRTPPVRSPSPARQRRRVGDRSLSPVDRAETERGRHRSRDSHTSRRSRDGSETGVKSWLRHYSGTLGRGRSGDSDLSRTSRRGRARDGTRGYRSGSRTTAATGTNETVADTVPVPQRGVVDGPGHAHVHLLGAGEHAPVP